MLLSVVFIHGLRGHPRGTWEAAAGATYSSGATEKPKGFRSLIKRGVARSPSRSIEQAQASSTISSFTPSPTTVFWPEEYLASDLPQAQLWTYGYDADIVGGLFQANNKNSISQHGRDLDDEAIRRSEKIRNQTKLIIFLGTPHRGSAYSGWGQIISNLARVALQDSNKKLVKTLDVNHEVLDNIHEEFKAITFKGFFKIHSFQEAQGVTGMKGLDEKVVDDFSSKLDLPRELETVESINVNHMQMARYSSKEDEGYRAISGILKDFVRQELGSQQFQSTNITDVACMKSQIAIEYAYRIQREEPHTLVVWIHASNPTRFKQGYRDFADKISLPGREDAKADILQLVYVWLSDRRNGQWLIILDNVDGNDIFFTDSEDTTGSAPTIYAAEHRKPLESFLPQTSNGTILITSRNKTAAINLVGGHGDIVQVEPMGEKDALALLQTRISVNQSSQADAKALVYALEYIPLAITHAAAYIKTRASTTTLSTYLKLFRGSEANQVHLLRKEEWKDIRRDHSIRHAVIATWQISFAQIQETDPSAAELLALMSMFDKQGIPKWLLKNNTSQLDFDDALAPLLSFSLVRTEVGKQTLGMHRLVQVSMRAWLKVEGQLSKWTKESIRILSMAFPSGDYKTWANCKVLLPHLKEVISHTKEDKEDWLNQAKSTLSAGWYLFLRGEYKAAEGLVRMSVGTREEVLGLEHPETLTSVSQLGSALERQGKYEEAEAMHRRALTGREKVLGPEHPHTLTSVSNLGSALKSQGKYKEAEAMHRRDLTGSEKVLGPEHPDTLISVSQLGSALESQGKYKEAEAMHRRALTGYEKVLGPEHPYTLISVSKLGSALESQGKYEEAEAIHRRALTGREKVLGPEHPDTLTSVSHLGSVLERQGKYEEAEAMHRRALTGYEKVLRPEHPYTLTSVSKLGSVLERQGKYEEAEAMY
ncbi:MAG: hypothetical protein Q9160_009060 [Pyrenula sp. 1 TL-2023]